MDYFFISVIGFSLGVFARSVFVFGWWAILFLILLAVIFLVLRFLYQSKNYLAAAVLFFAFAIGAGRVMLAPHALPDTFVPLLDTHISLDGVITNDPDIRENNQHVEIRIQKDGESTALLAFAPLYPSLSYGEEVTVAGILKQPEPFATDGGREFAYDKFLAKDGIFAIVPQAHIDVVVPPSGVLAISMNILYGIKHAFARGLEAALPEPASALAEGLLVGGKQGLGASLIDAFTIAGLLQIVVLSGYNVMIVAEAVLRGFSFLSKRFAVVASVVSIAGFVLAAGAGSSALRAGLMACIALLARAGGRSYDALRGLALALLILLLWNPYLLVYDPGFDLSFIATLGLIIGTSRVEPYLIRIKSAFLRDIMATTIAAQVAVLPLLLYQTGNLSIVALPANVLAMLAVPFAMAASFIAGIAGILLPSVAPVMGIPAYILLSYVIAVARYSAALPFAHINIPAFPFAVAVLFYVLLSYAAFRKRSSATAQLKLSKKASI